MYSQLWPIRTLMGLIKTVPTPRSSDWQNYINLGRVAEGEKIVRMVQKSGLAGVDCIDYDSEILFVTGTPINLSETYVYIQGRHVWVELADEDDKRIFRLPSDELAWRLYMVLSRFCLVPPFAEGNLFILTVPWFIYFFFIDFLSVYKIMNNSSLFRFMSKTKRKQEHLWRESITNIKWRNFGMAQTRKFNRTRSFAS